MKPQDSRQDAERRTQDTKTMRSVKLYTKTDDSKEQDKDRNRRIQKNRTQKMAAPSRAEPPTDNIPGIMKTLENQDLERIKYSRGVESVRKCRVQVQSASTEYKYAKFYRVKTRKRVE